MINQLYLKQVEAWKERFIIADYSDGQKAKYNSLLLSRHKDTIELLEALKSQVDGMGFVNPAEAGQFAMHTDGYNQAIEEVVEYLEEQLKLIKKEL